MTKLQRCPHGLVRTTYTESVECVGGAVLAQVSADELNLLGVRLGDKLSEMTMEEGVDLPHPTILVRREVGLVLGIRVRSKTIGAKVLVE
ncbi:hypothetical protein HYV64_05710 [Candidatus Shapirobacteria bacterium]|nr:hypothetical protein [Candidatus Shapirobacteria bacterium]